MPIGIIVDIVCYIIGTIIGAALGKRTPVRISKALVLVLGYATIALGVALLLKLYALPPVIFSVTIGTLIGEIVDIEGRLTKGLRAIGDKLGKSGKIAVLSDSAYIDRYITIIMVFVFGATGILGSLTEGMTGDSSVMMSKAVIDIMASATFATTMGLFILSIAGLQVCFFIPLYLLAFLIVPHTDAAMIANFSACGGVIAIITGFKVCEIKHYAITNTLPAFLLIMPVTWIWNMIFG